MVKLGGGAKETVPERFPDPPIRVRIRIGAKIQESDPDPFSPLIELVDLHLKKLCEGLIDDLSAQYSIKVQLGFELF